MNQPPLPEYAEALQAAGFELFGDASDPTAWVVPSDREEHFINCCKLLDLHGRRAVSTEYPFNFRVSYDLVLIGSNPLF